MERIVRSYPLQRIITNNSIYWGGNSYEYSEPPNPHIAFYNRITYRLPDETPVFWVPRICTQNTTSKKHGKKRTNNLEKVDFLEEIFGFQNFLLDKPEGVWYT